MVPVIERERKRKKERGMDATLMYAEDDGDMLRVRPQRNRRSNAGHPVHDE